MARWHVYRITDSGRLWAGKSRLRRSADPAPLVDWGSTYWMGNGAAISWETHRSKARLFDSRIVAGRHVIAQGWPEIDLRVIPEDAEPTIDDEPPKPYPGRYGSRLGRAKARKL